LQIHGKPEVPRQRHAEAKLRAALGDEVAMGPDRVLIDRHPVVVLLESKIMRWSHSLPKPSIEMAAVPGNCVVIMAFIRGNELAETVGIIASGKNAGMPLPMRA
jgi:hypothetical protein